MSDDKEVQEAPKAPKFVFVGDPNDGFSGPNIMDMKGTKFLKNRATKVPEGKVHFFSEHSHFMTEEEFAEHNARLGFEDEEEGGLPAKAYEEYSNKELKQLCEERNIEFAGNASNATLIALLEEHDEENEG